MGGLSVSNPNTELAQTLFSVSTMFREQYFDVGGPNTTYLGSVTNRMFSPAEELAYGDGKTFQLQTRRSDSARSSRLATEDFKDQRRLSTANVKLRYHDTTESLNDFHTIDTSAEVGHMELMAGPSEAVAINIVERLMREVPEGVSESWARLIHAGSSGSLGTVDGTPKDADGVDYDSATSYTSGATQAIFKIAGFGADSLQPGMRLSAYSAAGALQADEMEVIRKNPSDNSVWVSLVTEGPNQSSVANLDSLATAAVLYRSDEKDKGMKSSPANWVTAPTTGESFIGGIDRLTLGYAWMIPHVTRNSASSTTLKKSHFDDYFNSIAGLRGRNEPGSTVTPSLSMHPSHEDTLREEIGEDAFTVVQANHDGMYNFGEERLTYIHPVAGRIVLVSDSLAPRDKVRCYIPEDWKKVYYGFRGLNFMPGTIGMFRQKDGATAGVGSKYFRAEGYEVAGFICFRPERNGAIMNVTGA